MENPLEFAMKMELEGKEYYTKQAKNTGDPQIKQILEMLARDEEAHYQVVKQMSESRLYEYHGSNTLDKAKSIFEQRLESDDQPYKDTSPIEVYDKALDFEKESVELYRGLAKQANTRLEKEIYGKLAKEEEGHWRIIWNVLELLRKPEEWYPYLEW